MLIDFDSKMCNRNRFAVFIAVVTIFKLVLMANFTSDYTEKLFMPFVNNFLQHPLSNPYADFLQSKGYVAFPYPPLMLLVESLGGYICKAMGLTTALGSFGFKVSILIFDFMGMFFLMKLYPKRRKYIGVLYFVSPIVMYAAYMHGQLDLIPTSLLLGAIFYLFSNVKYGDILFAIFLTASILTKLHILAVLPLFVIYLWNKGDYSKLRNLVLTLLLAMIVMLPFAESTYFWQSILFNNEQALLSKVFVKFVDRHLYLPIFAMAIIYIHIFMLRNINKDLFISFCGMIFAVFLALLPPMPGWYIWIVPFITVFFIVRANNKYKNLYLYAFLNTLYLIYFLTAHSGNYVELYFQGKEISGLYVENANYVNTLFTLMTAALIYLIYEMYIYGIASNLFYKRRGQPFTIGIAGDSGTGKTTILKLFENCLGKKNILLLEGDGDHKWERNAENWQYYTHLNPKANYLYRQAKDIAALRSGNVIKRVDYDHKSGSFTKEHKIYPRKYVMLSGLHAFYLPQMRQVMDLKIFMDTDEALRRYWKIQRDTTKRGYSPQKILEQIEARTEDNEKYIHPQKKFADIIIHYFDENLVDCCNTDYRSVISLKFILSSSINLEPLVDFMHKNHIVMEYDFSPNLAQQVIIFKGESLEGTLLDFADAVYEIIPQAEEIISELMVVNNNREGIIQLMLLLVISYKMRM